MLDLLNIFLETRRALSLLDSNLLQFNGIVLIDNKFI